MKKEARYCWQGQPVKVRFGYCLIQENKEKPLWWWNYEVLEMGKEIIEAIEVTTDDGHVFVIANHFGCGVGKLEKGGWPNFPHFSLDGCDFRESFKIKIVKYDPVRHFLRELDRDKWMKKTYQHTDEYKRMMGLRDLINQKTTK